MLKSAKIKNYISDEKVYNKIIAFKKKVKKKNFITFNCR